MQNNRRAMTRNMLSGASKGAQAVAKSFTVAEDMAEAQRREYSSKLRGYIADHSVPVTAKDASGKVLGHGTLTYPDLLVKP